jgi:hypothetical protein
LMAAVQRPAFSRAAPIRRYECQHETRLSNISDLVDAQRRQLKCDVRARLEPPPPVKSDQQAPDNDHLDTSVHHDLE